MKMMVRVAIVVATLLGVSYMAFAAVCDQELCYDVTLTIPNAPPINCSYDFCLMNDGTGQFCGYNGCTGCIDLLLFGGGPGWPNTSGSPAFGGKPLWTEWLAVSDDVPGESAFFQPMGAGKELLTGIKGFHVLNFNVRSTVSGKKAKEPCPGLACPAGYANCDLSTANGCEININTDAANCGTCGNACGGGTPNCSGGLCVP